MEPPLVVMLPYPAMGHIKPMFMMAQLLAQADFKITFVNTLHPRSRFFDHFNQSAFCAQFPNFKFSTIDDGLPADHPNSGSESAKLLYSMVSACKTEFKELLTKQPPTCIITDEVMSSVNDIGEELDIPVITFRCHSATFAWVNSFLQKLVDSREVPVRGNYEDMNGAISLIPGLESILRRRDLPSACRLELDNPYLQFSLSQSSKTCRSSPLILNTFDDLEGPIVSQLYSIHPKVYTLGPLHDLVKSRVNPPMYDSSNGSSNQEDRTCIAWLDSQPSKSVIFVSFGTMIVLSHDQLMEFWHGLVNSQKSFLWVIRSDLISDNNNKYNTDKVLNEVIDGTRERGCIVSWAPQEDVLAHPAVGGFLTHGGWNSTLESICAGVPMICWPLIMDQQLNSRCVSHMWNFGLDMKDTCERSIIEKMVRDLIEGTRDDILKSASDFSWKASQSVKEGGSSYKNLDKLIEDIRSIRSAKCSLEDEK